MSLLTTRTTFLSLKVLMLWLLSCHYKPFSVMAHSSTTDQSDLFGFENFWNHVFNNDTNEGISIKVLTYNIHHAAPPSKHGKIDIDAIAQVINNASPDLVAIQEVNVNTRRSGKINEAQLLATKTGMNFFFAKTLNRDGGRYGILILSKYPIHSRRKYMLPTKKGTGAEPRALATAEITLPNNRTILFACTHLDFHKLDTNRLLQIKEILKILKNVTLPVIIGGDFNAHVGSPTISRLDSQFTRTCTQAQKICGFTVPASHARKTIDYIAYKPKSAYTVQNHAVINGTLARYASDHLPVEATLLLK